jgi:hypothetical protein
MADTHVKISHVLHIHHPYNRWMRSSTMQKAWADAESVVGNASCMQVDFWRAHLYSTSTAYYHALGESFQITLGDSNMRHPYMWTHIEAENTFIQGVLGYRPATDEGDNIRILKRNSMDYKSSVLTAVGGKEGSVVDEQNFIGVAYLPMTDRI